MTRNRKPTDRSPVYQPNSALGREMMNYLEASTPGFASRHIRPTIEGDIESAESLCVTLDNDSRGEAAVAAWHLGLPKPVLRVIVDNVWNHDHLYFMQACRNASSRRQGHKMARQIFMDCEFEIPAGIPNKVKIYRGMNYDDMSDWRGLAWTLCPSTAAFFCFFRMSEEAKPILLEAEISKSEIIYYCDERFEREVIPRARPPHRLWKMPYSADEIRAMSKAHKWPPGALFDPITFVAA